MKISIIGSGNVATHLGNAFYRAGHEVAEVYSRSREHAAELAGKTHARAITDLSGLSDTTDLCLIAVKDDAISTVLKNLTFSKTIMAHTAGSISMEILKGSSPNYGVFYPFQTFSKFREPDLSGVPFCIEASNPETLRRLEELARSIDGKACRIDSGQREVLHIAAVFASNFSNHLYALAEQMLEEKQLPFDIIRPLIGETAAKVMQVSPLIAQTGPAVRNDQQVIAAHLELLGNRPELKELYKALTESIIRQHNK